MYIRNETVTTQKPHAEIREALVTGIRNNPDKPNKLKAAAEVLISCIDQDGTPEAFQQAYVVFHRAAGNEPLPEILSPAEYAKIAKAFGLGKGGEA